MPAQFSGYEKLKKYYGKVEDEDKNQKQVAFDMGVLHVRTEKLYDDLGKITHDIDPEPFVWGDDDDDNDRSGRNDIFDVAWRTCL